MPAFWVLTDPARTPDPAAIARVLPAGSGLIYRHFGADDRFDIAARLRRITSKRLARFLVSWDPELERSCGADGIHWPEKLLNQHRQTHRAGLQTTSAHTIRALHRAQGRNMDAVFCSSIFPSQSPTAGPPIGPCRLGAWTRGSACPVYALGGINARTIRRLNGLGLAGVGVVGAATP